MTNPSPMQEDENDYDLSPPGSRRASPAPPTAAKDLHGIHANLAQHADRAKEDALKAARVPPSLRALSPHRCTRLHPPALARSASSAAVVASSSAAGPRAGGRLQGGGRGRWLASPSGAACGGPHHKVGGLLGPNREQSSSRLSPHLSRLTSRTFRSQVVQNTELKFLVRAPWLLGLFVPPPAWPSEHLTVQAAPAQRFSIRD